MANIRACASASRRLAAFVAALLIAVAASEASGPGFRTQRHLEEHYAKHGREFGIVTASQYLRMAQEFRDAASGPELLEAVRQDGVVTRFHKKKGWFLAFDPDRTIRTFFIPNDGERYFWRQARRTAKGKTR
jgi:pyocin large subunit-like protein